MRNKTFVMISQFVVIILLASMVLGATVDDRSIITVSLINQDPDPALAGNTVELRFGVENSGGITSNNIMLEIMPDPILSDSLPAKGASISAGHAINAI